MKRQSKTSCLFTAKSTRNKGIEELSITAKKGGVKNGKSPDQRSCRSLLFIFRLGSALVSRSFAARPSHPSSFLVLAFYRVSKEKQDTAHSLSLDGIEEPYLGASLQTQAKA